MKNIDDMTDQLAENRRELREVRKQVAQALGGDVLDEGVLGAALTRVDDMLAKTNLQLGRALTEVQAALDGEQRRELAELLAERGGHGGHARRGRFGRRDF